MNPQTSQDALNQMQQYRATMRNPADILQEQNKSLGVDNSMQQITGLRGAINNTTKMLQRVAPSIMGRTAHSLVNSAQATGQIANAQRPIAEQLSQQGTLLANANDEYGRLSQQAREAASGIYSGQQDQLSYLQNLYSSLAAREQEAENRRRWEIARQDELNKEAENRRAAAAQQSALNNYLRNTGTLGTSTGVVSAPGAMTTSKPADEDAAYLGRLQEQYKDDKYGLITILRGMQRSTNPKAQRRYLLAAQMGLVPSNANSGGGGGW